jgi:hypothetical protein
MTELTAKQAELCERSTTDYSDLKAFFINCTLKRSPELSHTQGLMDIAMEIMRRNRVQVDGIRAIDHQIATGVWPDMTEHGWERDDWPQIFERVIAADILVLGMRSGSARSRRSRRRSSSGSTATPTCSTTPASTRTTAAPPAAW